MSERPYKRAWPLRRGTGLFKGPAWQALRSEVRRCVPRGSVEDRGDLYAVRQGKLVGHLRFRAVARGCAPLPGAALQAAAFPTPAKRRRASKKPCFTRVPASRADKMGDHKIYASLQRPHYIPSRSIPQIVAYIVLSDSPNHCCQPLGFSMLFPPAGRSPNSSYPPNKNEKSGFHQKLWWTDFCEREIFLAHWAGLRIRRPAESVLQSVGLDLFTSCASTPGSAVHLVFTWS